MDKYFAFFILFATIAGSFCAEPVNVESSTQAVKEAQPQKRHIAAINDCDGPVGVVGLQGGLHSDVAVHGDLALGLHGHGYAAGYASGYAPSYAQSYAPSFASSYGGGYLAGGSLSHIGSLAHGGIVGQVGHIGSLGAIVAAPQIVAGGYAPHAPILASSVHTHAPFAVAAPAAIAVQGPTITKVHQVPVPVPYPVPKPIPVAVPVDRPVIVPKPVAVPHPVPYPVHHVITKKVTVPYPVPVPSPSVSYSSPVIVGHGLYDHPYGNRIYGHGLYSSPGYSSGIKVISPGYSNSYRYGGIGGYGSSYGGYGGYGGGYGSYGSIHGGYGLGHSSLYGGSYHSGLSLHGGGLGISLGTKHGWPLKFGLKYNHW